MDTTPKKREMVDSDDISFIRRPSNLNKNQVELSDIAKSFIKTRIFQRLRRISQLGSAQYIFPSATHTRFEHSLGVADLANRMVHNMNYNLQDRINRKKIYGGDYSCDDRIDSNDLKLIEIAGLCHDLGHGPHSHLYERMMKKRGIDFCHEEQSVKLFKKIVDENCIDLTESEIKMIGSIITDNGVPDWKMQIVSNGKNGIDVDRLDYIRRDSHHLDIPTSFKSSDLINSSVLLNGRVCFLQDAQDSIEDMFTTRYSLYKKVYTHKDVTAVELLFTDLMLESYQYIDILKADPSDLYSFEQLDDSITNTIRYSTSYELSKAREIVKNLDQENYYKCVSEIKQDERNEHLLKNLNNENLSACISGLKPDDIIIDDQYLVVGNWDDIPLVQSNTSKDSYFVEPSLLFPTENKSITRRIYARDSSKVDLVRNAVDSFVNNHSLSKSCVVEC